MIKTTSLETSRLLKASGYRPEHTQFEWVDGELEHCPSPTTDELLEELPEKIGEHELTISKLNNKYWIIYSAEERGNLHWDDYTNESLPEALAKMWLYLKQEGLLQGKE